VELDYAIEDRKQQIAAKPRGLPGPPPIPARPLETTR
jgi:hypothetical protein